MFLLQQLGNISTLGFFFTWDAADYLLWISAKSDMKLQEDLVNSNWQVEFNTDKCKLRPARIDSQLLLPVRNKIFMLQ